MTQNWSHLCTLLLRARLVPAPEFGHLTSSFVIPSS